MEGLSCFKHSGRFWAASVRIKLFVTVFLISPQDATSCLQMRILNDCRCGIYALRIYKSGVGRFFFHLLNKPDGETHKSRKIT